MPTALPRHSVTETAEVARALDDAAKRWPADSGNRARLLLRLVAEGHRAVVGEQARLAGERRDAVTATRGALTGVYTAEYLRELREEWPE